MRARPLGQGRPRTHLRARPAASEGRRRLARQAARPVDASPRSIRCIRQGAETMKLDPKLDLVLERVVDVPPSLVWACWTMPKHIKKWFTPAPWKTVECKVDLQPGGTFYTVFEGPEGQRIPNAGCFLEIVKNERLVWTNALLAGYRPAVL